MSTISISESQQQDSFRTSLQNDQRANQEKSEERTRAARRFEELLRQNKIPQSQQKLASRPPVVPHPMAFVEENDSAQHPDSPSYEQETTSTNDDNSRIPANGQKDSRPIDHHKDNQSDDYKEPKDHRNDSKKTRKKSSSTDAIASSNHPNQVHVPPPTAHHSAFHEPAFLFQQGKDKKQQRIAPVWEKQSSGASKTENSEAKEPLGQTVSLSQQNHERSPHSPVTNRQVQQEKPSDGKVRTTQQTTPTRHSFKKGHQEPDRSTKGNSFDSRQSHKMTPHFENRPHSQKALQRTERTNDRRPERTDERNKNQNEPQTTNSSQNDSAQKTRDSKGKYDAKQNQQNTDLPKQGVVGGEQHKLLHAKAANSGTNGTGSGDQAQALAKMGLSIADLADAVSRLKSGDAVTLHVRPEKLPATKIEICRQGSGILITMSTSSLAAQQTIHNNLPTLMQAFKSTFWEFKPVDIKMKYVGMADKKSGLYRHGRSSDKLEALEADDVV